MVKVLSSSGRHLGIADTWWQLQDILEKTSDPDVIVEESVFQLPTMLITKDVMKSVHNAIKEHREEAEGAQDTGESRDAGDKTAKNKRGTKATPISKCIRMTSMDHHMDGGMSKASVHIPVCKTFRFPSLYRACKLPASNESYAGHF